ncbi:MAG: hypothetical protein PW734_01050 [Verrucomicrobium sp.]|nr:hypothetical protein [Verrucomicrobium sp.]
MDQKKRLIVSLGLLLALAGCSSAPYASRQSTTSQITDAGVEYGGPLALGAAGFFAGRAMGHSDTAGALGALAGAAAGIGFDVFANAKRKEAYRVGMEDGANMARAEQAIDQWKREAVYNAPRSQVSALQPVYRPVYVHSRSINGVTYPGGYQEVPVYP